MTDNTLQQVALSLKEDWDLPIPDSLSEEAILQLLADRVVTYLEKGPDAFYRLMYRIDVSEKKLNAVLGDEHVADKIARLIYDRQLQKIQSRKQYKSPPAHTDDDLKW
jgi:hypothetical protein